MKKFLSLLITISLVLSLAGCSIGNKKKTALVISGTEINEEIYNYYLDLVESRPEDYDLSTKYSDSDAQSAAINLCVRYLAFNTLFRERDLSLSASEKVTVADNVNNYWIRSENHYDEIGVSRETLTKILTSEAYEDKIFDDMYDPGTDDEANEEIIKDYFYSNYTAFRNICAYFTNGSTALSEQEKQDLIASFNEIAAVSGDTADGFTTACSDAGYTASGTVILNKNSDGYPSGFFMKVFAMDTNQVKVFDYDECVFAIRKESLEELGDGVYSEYRSDCIEAMYADDWAETISSYLENFTIDEIKV